MSITVIEGVKEVFWETTKEVTVKVNGEVMTIRVIENPNGITTLVLIHNQWRDLEHIELTPNLKELEELLEEISIAELTE